MVELIKLITQCNKRHKTDAHLLGLRTRSGRPLTGARCLWALLHDHRRRLAVTNASSDTHLTGRGRLRALASRVGRRLALATGAALVTALLCAPIELLLLLDLRLTQLLHRLAIQFASL